MMGSRMGSVMGWFLFKSAERKEVSSRSFECVFA